MAQNIWQIKYRLTKNNLKTYYLILVDSVYLELIKLSTTLKNY